MVQVLPSQKNIGSAIGQSLGMGLHSGLSQAFQNQQQQSQQDPEIEKRNYDTIKDAFGDKFANVWQATGQGERTNLTRAALEAASRGQDVRKLFDQIPEGALPNGQSGNTQSGFPEYKLNTQGMTPKERIGYQSELRKANSPLRQAASAKVRSVDSELKSLNLLDNLNNSGKLPEGLGRLIINPKTKQPYAAAELTGKINPETQRFIKTINDFTTKAKDTFGSRVTNFDLQQFLARLPSLTNTPEGRRGIINQMRISSEIDRIHADALQKVYSKYGLGNITEEDAEQIAESLIQPQVKALADQYAQVENQLESLSNNSQQAPPTGMVALFDPQGNLLHVPENEVERLVKAGAKKP